MGLWDYGFVATVVIYGRKLFMTLTECGEALKQWGGDVENEFEIVEGSRYCRNKISRLRATQMAQQCDQYRGRDYNNFQHTGHRA